MDTRLAAGTIVLVHGGFVDGSGWRDVYNLLTQGGYNVRIVQNPTLSLEGDVAAANFILDAQVEPGTLVGPSYRGGGGAGRHDQRAGLAEQAELVPRRDRGRDDPPAGPARDGRTGGFDRGRGRGQPRDLPVAAGGRGRARRQGRLRSARGRALNP